MKGKPGGGEGGGGGGGAFRDSGRGVTGILTRSCVLATSAARCAACASTPLLSSDTSSAGPCQPSSRCTSLALPLVEARTATQGYLETLSCELNCMDSRLHQQDAQTVIYWFDSEQRCDGTWEACTLWRPLLLESPFECWQKLQNSRCMHNAD